MPTIKQLSTFLEERMEKLSGEERGIYLQIALHQIKYKDIKKDGNIIASITNTDPETVKKCWPNVKKILTCNNDRMADTELAKLLEPKKRKSKPKTPAEPPSEQEVIDYFTEHGYSREQALKAYNYYSDMDWYDSTGKPVLRWKGKMRANWFREEVKQNTVQSIW